LIEKSRQNPPFRLEDCVHGWHGDLRSLGDSLNRHPREAFGAQEPVSGANDATAGFSSLALASDGFVGAPFCLCQWLEF